jgi:hypothetical protein
MVALSTITAPMLILKCDDERRALRSIAFAGCWHRIDLGSDDQHGSACARSQVLISMMMTTTIMRKADLRVDDDDDRSSFASFVERATVSLMCASSQLHHRRRLIRPTKDLLKPVDCTHRTANSFS